ncbi:protein DETOXIFICATION 19-like [Panicum virgatum]|uniref:protein DETOXIFICATION 19-like n=1 Tax=Panicum virgatum TaxID=38727 RepID=UPI0019D55E7C|nr:protein DETOXIFICATION 19-like [Panicum virgatum]
MYTAVWANTATHRLRKESKETQSVVLPLVICSVAPFSVAPFPLDVLLAYLLVNVLGLGLAGAPTTVSATLWVSFLMLLAYVLLSKKFSEMWRGFSADAFKYVLPAVKRATPSAIMVCLELWVFELLVLIAGLLPNPTVNTPLIAMCSSSTEAIICMISVGFSATVSTRVANKIGAGNVDRARNL